MNETLLLILASVAGAAFGAIFFGGLWWTVRKGVSSPRPALWFFGSLLARMSIVLAGFYFVGSGHWERLVAALVGFIVARLIVVRLTRVPVGHSGSPAKGVQTRTAQLCSLSSLKGGEGRGEEAQLFSTPQPSPRSGGERESGSVPAKEASHAP